MHCFTIIFIFPKIGKICYLIQSFVVPVWINRTQFSGYSVVFSSENRMEYAQSQLFIHAIIAYSIQIKLPLLKPFNHNRNKFHINCEFKYNY